MPRSHTGFGADEVRGRWLGDPGPGRTSGAVLTTDEATVRAPGYAGSVRNVPTAVKDQVSAEYGITSHAPYQYEIDHDISLEPGGSNELTNLWPEPNDNAEGGRPGRPSLGHRPGHEHGRGRRGLPRQHSRGLSSDR